MADGSVFARVHVLVLCDEIDERPAEEAVFDLRGVRSHVSARLFPYVHPELWVYLQLTGHEGLVTGRVVGTNEATDEQIVYRVIDEIHLQGPLTIIHVLLQILDCRFPSPGVYWFQVFANEKLIAERRFLVSEAGGATNGQPIH
jgi:hypothetical protein